MQASEKQFTAFISGDVTCVIPVYQRNYDWKIANCARLFDDIKNVIKEDKPHFIGTFVYKQEPAGDIFQDYVIIDGQQRIASIILFARALYDFADAGLKKDINAKFLRHTSNVETRNVYRLRPTEIDCDVFSKIMEGVTDFTENEKRSAMFKNYDFFCKQLAAAIAQDSSHAQDLPQEFFKAIHKLKVVSIQLNDENAQAIFESLNSTGLNLTQADLIRNFLFMSFEEYERQEELYKTYWRQIEELLRPLSNVENFIVQYLITRRKSNSVPVKKQLNKTNLYEVFKEYFKKYFDSDVEACLSDMLRYAKFFRRCIFNDDDFDKLSALDKKFYELVYLLKGTNAPIILMYLLDRHEKNLLDEATFIKFVDALISLTFRAKVCKRGGIDQQTAGNILSRLGDSLDENSFWRAITGGKGSYTFPNNADFQAALTDNTLNETLKDNSKYFLYALEKNSAPNLPAYSEVVVEYIMPKTLNNAWKKYLRERNDSANAAQWINSAGNLALVDKRSNTTFDSKKLRYGLSPFSFTRAISGCSTWTSNQIQARAKKLAAAALKVWTLPDEFNATIKSTENLFYLDSDFSACKGRKLASYSFLGETKTISDWSKFVLEIAKQLYTLDENIFLQATQMDNVPKRKNLFTSEPTNLQIADGYYMTLQCDTESCLKIAKALVENFDRLSDNNFKDDIWFTLKTLT